MVHTELVGVRKHLPHMPQLAAAGFSSEQHFHFVRPNHAQHPERSWGNYLRKMRLKLVSPDHVARVAVADDADEWVDIGLTGPEAEKTRWLRGRWVDGVWHGVDGDGGELRGKVCEGRVLGYSIWRRDWPEAAEDMRREKEKCGSGTVWPLDTWWKKLERAAFALADAYLERIDPDPAESKENLAVIMGTGFEQYRELVQPVKDRCRHVGFIYLLDVVVDPAFHRRGIGARLMRWGLERAEKERCPILLIATSTGSGLYRKLGFEILGTLNVGQLSSDMVMVYWPTSFEQPAVDDVQQRVAQAVENPEVKSQDEGATPAVTEVVGI